jgi:TetR/AcrR family acrAB operon transcriptional repressor
LARKTKELAQETREKLLESALDVMSKKPFPNVSMAEIAENIGLSKGAAYWHFKNKNGLIISLLEDICEKYEGDFHLAEQNPSDFEGLRSFFRQKIISVMNNERTQKINELINRRHEWPKEVFERVIARVCEMTRHELEIVAGVISRAQERREIRDDIPAGDVAALFSAMSHGLLFFQLHEIYMMDFAKYETFLFDALEKALKFG